MTFSATVVICAAPQSGASEELVFAEQELLESLSGIPVRYVETAGGDLLGRARQAAIALKLPAEQTVIFLTHGALWLAPETLAACQAWARANPQGLGLVADSRVAGLQPAPDYLTLRGFEDYARRLSGMSAWPAPETDFQPLALACRVAALNHPDASRAFIPGGFAHDFGAYHQLERREMLACLPEQCDSILDVGGGEGYFLAQVKALRGCETHLAEYAEHACRAAQHRVDRVWQGDFLATDFGRGFDCVSFLDVLEHTTAPGRWLEKARSLLNPGGAILMSIPNVGHWSVIADLLAGRWDYVPAGIHCITHLRFFTRSGIEKLLEGAGLYCEKMDPVVVPTPDWFRPEHGMGGVLALDHDAMNAYAYHVQAKVRP